MVELNDEEHVEILKNREANKTLAQLAVARAVEDGMAPSDAERMYGYREPEREPDTATVNRILSEVTLGTPMMRPDTPKEAALREQLVNEVEQAKEDGLVISPARE